MIRTILEKSIYMLGRAPNFPGKWRIMRTMSAIFGPLYITTPYGPKMLARFEDFTNRAAIFGLYGPSVFNEILKLRAGDVFIDIGANAGVWTLAAAQRVGKNGRVIAFEPQKKLGLELRQNVIENNFSNVSIFDFGIGDRTEWMHMENTSCEHTGVAYMSRHGGGPSTLIVNPSVDFNLLKHLCEDHHVLVKIDTEGAELSVLKGIGPMLRNLDIISVIVEINPEYLKRFGHKIEQIGQFMTDCGFKTDVNLELINHDDAIFIPRIKVVNRDDGGQVNMVVDRDEGESGQ